MHCPLMPREGLEREINATALQTRKVFVGLGSFLAGDPRMKSTLTPSDTGPVSFAMEYGRVPHCGRCCVRRLGTGVRWMRRRVGPRYSGTRQESWRSCDSGASRKKLRTRWRCGVYSTIGNIHSNPSSVAPCDGTVVMPRILLALGLRLVDVEDDGDSPIAADSLGERWIYNETQLCSRSRSRRERSHLFCTATVAKRVIESGW